MSTSAKTNARPPLQLRDCGLADYRQVLHIQKDLRDRRRSGDIGDTVLIVEHLPVITLGARKSANKLLIDENVLADRDIEVVPIRRGGGATAHNPGQLVFYPILDLSARNLSVNTYVRTLEAIGIELLARLSVTAERTKGYPGLWVQPDAQFTTDTTSSNSTPEIRNTKYEIRYTRKIASIGVRVSRFITYHGMAINICNNLAIFDAIVPCGLDNVRMTSVLEETGRRHDMPDVKRQLAEILKDHFN